MHAGINRRCRNLTETRTELGKLFELGEPFPRRTLNDWQKQEGFPRANDDGSRDPVKIFEWASASGKKAAQAVDELEPRTPKINLLRLVAEKSAVVALEAAGSVLPKVLGAELKGKSAKQIAEITQVVWGALALRLTHAVVIWDCLSHAEDDEHYTLDDIWHLIGFPHNSAPSDSIPIRTPKEIIAMAKAAGADCFTAIDLAAELKKEAEKLQ
jgi:hypothetical protein